MKNNFLVNLKIKFMKRTFIYFSLLIVIMVILYACDKNGTGTNNPTIPYGSMTDQDGNIYKTVIIGNQTWMAENLRTTRYNDGTTIPIVSDAKNWAGLRTPGMCTYNNTTDVDSIYTFGRLYNWYVVNTGKVAPVGWHVPSDSEFQELINNLGGMYEAGGKLKETGIIHWGSPNLGATNSTGFTALPSGYRNGAGDFANIGKEGMWWSSTIGAPYGTYASYFSLSFNSALAGRDNHLVNEFGFTIRCLKD